MSNQAANAAGYGETARVLASEREVEYRVFSQVTGRLSMALRPDAPFSELAAALHDNSRLWTALAADLAHPDNTLPDALKAQLVGLAIFTRKHADRVLARQAEAGPLVDINKAVMGGLRARRGQESAC